VFRRPRAVQVRLVGTGSLAGGVGPTSTHQQRDSQQTASREPTPRYDLVVRYSRGIVVALLATGALAHADLPPAKGLPPEYSYQAVRTFVAANRAERRGDFETAHALLSELYKTEPHPNVTFNLGRLFLRVHAVEQAREKFIEYAETLGKGADRTELAKLDAALDSELRSEPVTIGDEILGGADVDAMVFVDGELGGTSPYQFPSDDKLHRVARVGPTIVTKYYVRPRSSRYYWGDFLKHYPGNVYVDLESHRFDWSIDGRSLQTDYEWTMKPGRYSTSFEGKICTPITFEVKPDTMTYVYVENGPLPDGGCAKINRVRVHYVKAVAP
jgi:hypothetical protein